jgi:hypothetical protein
MSPIDILKTSCAEALANPAFAPNQPTVGETHCNEAAMFIAQAMGCGELQGLMADQQYAKMLANVGGHWAKVTGAEASQHAIAGGLAFAAASSGMLGETHGHICVIEPEPMRFSGSLNKLVPEVCNVGRANADEKESEAFPVSMGEPDYFTWG